jgi:hypothetical protein
MSSKVVLPPPKSGPTKKIGVLKIARTKAKPAPRGMLEIELALMKPIRVSKIFCLLDTAGSSHGPHAAAITATHTAHVPAFNNLSDDSSPDVCWTPSHVRTIERRASPPPSVSSEFLCFSLTFCYHGP